MFLLHLKTSHQSWNIISSTSRAWIYQWGKPARGLLKTEEPLSNDEKVYSSINSAYVPLYQKCEDKKGTRAKPAEFFLLL